MTWTPRDEAERAAVVALYIKTHLHWKSSEDTMEEAAERIVPLVPAPEPELNTYKGVTYEHAGWSTAEFWYKGGRYATAAQLIASFGDDLTDDDHAALLDLKANPTVQVATPVNAVCALCNGTGYRTEHSTSANGGSVVSRKCSCGGAPILMNTTPATVAGEPVAPQGDQAPEAFVEYMERNYFGTVEFYSPRWHAEKIWVAARNAATPADAVALLVREGWKQRQYFDTCGTLATLHHGGLSGEPRVRVLIAPTPERAS